jgi:hypothetical protein
MGEAEGKSIEKGIILVHHAFKIFIDHTGSSFMGGTGVLFGSERNVANG